MDPEAAQQMGVNVAAMRSLTFGIAGLVGGIGGVLVGFYYQSIWPTMGIPLGIKGFTAALLGGIGSIPGAIVGGLLLGVFEALASGYLGSIYRNLIAYVLLLLVLFLRPQGLFGSRGLDALGGAQAAGGAVPTTSLMASPFQTAEPPAITTPGGSPPSSSRLPRPFPSGRRIPPGSTSSASPSSMPSSPSASPSLPAPRARSRSAMPGSGGSAPMSRRS